MNRRTEALFLKPEDFKLNSISDEAYGLYVRLASWCQHKSTKGFLMENGKRLTICLLAKKMGRARHQIKPGFCELLQAGLITRKNGQLFLPVIQERMEISETRAKAGQRRWTNKTITTSEGDKYESQ